MAHLETTAPGSALNIFGTVLAASGVDTTIASYTVPAHTTLFMTGIVCWGDTVGEYFLKVDGTVVGGTRNSAAEPISTVNYTQAPIRVLAGQLATVSVVHSNSAAMTMKCNLMGFNG